MSKIHDGLDVDPGRRDATQAAARKLCSIVLDWVGTAALLLLAIEVARSIF